MKTKLLLAIGLIMLAIGMASAQEVTKRGITPPRNIRNYDHDQPDALLGQMLGVRPYSSAVGDTLLGYVPVYYLGDSLLKVGTYTVLHTGNFSSLFTGISVSARFTGAGTSGSPLELATVGTGYGGTGITTYTTGDLLYASATNTLSKRAAGTNGYVLTMSGGVPTWSAPTGGVTGSGTANYLSKWTGGTVLGNSILYDDGTNLGIGISVGMTDKLTVNGSIAFSSTIRTTTNIMRFTSTGNNYTIAEVVPSGTSTLGLIRLWGGSDLSNSNYVEFGAGTTTYPTISITKTGTGVQQNLVFRGGSSTYWLFGSSATGYVGINNVYPLDQLDLIGSFRYSGVSKGADGSAASPAYTFTNDLDVGFYRPTTNQLGFATAGVERFKLGASGEVYFSAAAGASGQVLQSNGSASPPTWVNFPGVTGSSVAGMVAYWSGTSALTGSSIFTFDGTTLLMPSYIKSSGTIFNFSTNVSNSYVAVEFTPSGTSDLSILRMYNSSNVANATYVALSGQNSESYPTLSVTRVGTSTSGNLVIKVGSNTPIRSDYVTGYVGINTALINTTEQLTVTGNVRFSGALMPNGTAGTSGQVLQSAGAGAPPTWGTGSLLPSGSSGNTIRHNGTTWVVSSNLTNDGTNTSFTGAMLGPAGSAAAPAYSFTGDANNGWWSPSADVMAWSTAGTERLRIGATGNIISNNTPSVDWQTTTQFSAFTGSRGLYFTAIGDGITADELALKNPSGSTAFQAAFYEAAANGTSKVEVQAANSMSADYLQTLSPANGEIGVWLRTSATLDFPSTAPGTCSDMSVTLTGVSAGDSALPPGTFSTANTGVWSAHVFSSNTVTVRYCNCVVGTTQDPASQTFNINVKKVN